MEQGPGVGVEVVTVGIAPVPRDCCLLVHMQCWADSLNQSLGPIREHKNLPRLFLKLELPFAKEVLHLYF